jgi:heat shock protein HtpX
MAFAKRIFLFLAVNFLVVLMISVLLSVFHVRPFLQSYGIDYTSLILFCFIWGMGGAFISLALSRVMAKWLAGVQLIDPNTRDPQLAKLVEIVYRLSKEGGLTVMPQVGIFYSPEVNAFATGPSKRRSLVAVSSGLLNKMSIDEVEAVLAHEVTHITNGDMVTMTLIQGVVNAFVMFLARVLAFFFSGLGKSRDDSSAGSYLSYTLMVFLFEIVFMLLGSMVVAWFSRRREFRADAGGAKLTGKSKMIAALQALQRACETHPEMQHAKASSFDAMKISSKKKSGILLLFSTHPPLEERIERLQKS